MSGDELTFGSLFAGIGGFDLGLERAEMVCKWQVEIDPFCQKVLAKHWPHVARYSDVRECGAHNLEAVDLVCGGFPCQPFSEAGEQRGERDDRNLWPEMWRVIDELRPRWVVAENVPGIRNIYLDTVLSDLERLDYTTGTVDFPAVAFGAPHIRHRLFIVAHTDGPEQGWRQQQEWRQNQRNPESSRNGAFRYKVINGRPTSQTNKSGCSCENLADTEKQPVWTGLCADGQTKERWRRPGDGDCQGRSQWTIEPDVGRVADGIPYRVDRLRALGNAVVPQVAEWLGRRIVEVESACDRA